MEFVLTMPLLFILIMGVLQVGHIWTARLVTRYAAFCAARATLTANEMVCFGASAGTGPVYNAAKQVCAWVTFSDEGSNEADVPGWGAVPHSAEVTKRVRVTPRASSPAGGNMVGAPWLSGATVEFDFPLLMPVVGTMMGWLAENGSEGADFAIGSGWSGQSQPHDTYKGPYLTLKETVWLPRPYSIKRYPFWN